MCNDLYIVRNEEENGLTEGEKKMRGGENGRRNWGDREELRRRGKEKRRRGNRIRRGPGEIGAGGKKRERVLKEGERLVQSQLYT